MRHLLELNEYLYLEGTVPNIGLEKQPSDIIVKKDKITGLPTADKSQVPLIDQLKVLAKDLYDATISMGRSQTIMMDKMTALQQMGADEGIMQQMQQMMQDQMMALQMQQMDTEMQMMAIAGNNPTAAEKAQQLSSEAKFLADRQNDLWFKKRAKELEDKVVKQLSKKQEDEARKAQHDKHHGHDDHHGQHDKHHEHAHRHE